MVPRFLAIDYGTVRIGLALSYGTLAEPLPEINNSVQMYSQVAQLCDEHKIEKIIVGLSENDMASQTRVFVEQLKKHVTVPVIFTDETLSSYTATQRLRDLKRTSPKARSVVDSLAAASFLQDYLDDLEPTN